MHHTSPSSGLDGGPRPPASCGGPAATIRAAAAAMDRLQPPPPRETHLPDLTVITTVFTSDWQCMAIANATTTLSLLKISSPLAPNHGDVGGSPRFVPHFQPNAEQRGSAARQCAAVVGQATSWPMTARRGRRGPCHGKSEHSADSRPSAANHWRRLPCKPCLARAGWCGLHAHVRTTAPRR